MGNMVEAHAPDTTRTHTHTDTPGAIAKACTISVPALPAHTPGSHSVRANFAESGRRFPGPVIELRHDEERQLHTLAF